MTLVASERQSMGAAQSSGSSGEGAPPWLELIQKAVASVDFGTIQLKIHNREVVQIETTRKIRVPPA